MCSSDLDDMAILVVWASPDKDGLTAAAKDRVVLITPVYWHDLAENLKCLLDRMRRCASNRTWHRIMGTGLCSNDVMSASKGARYDLRYDLMHLLLHLTCFLPHIRVK